MSLLELEIVVTNNPTMELNMRDYMEYCGFGIIPSNYEYKLASNRARPIQRLIDLEDYQDRYGRTTYTEIL